MPHYRVYFLHPDNSVSKTVDLDCDSDGTAVDHIQAFRYANAMELWQGQRLVKRIEPPE